MPDYSTYSVEELQAQKILIDEQINALYAEKRAIAALEDAKLVRENAIRKAAPLTDQEKAALVQVIAAEGIPSEAQVGTPQ